MMVYKAEASANQVNCYWICYVRTRICSRSFHLSHHCCKCSVQGGVKSVGLRICAIYSVSRMVKIPLFASSDFLALLVCLHVGWLLLVCCSCRPQINCSELLCTVDNSKRLAFCFYETIERKNSKNHQGGHYWAVCLCLRKVKYGSENWWIHHVSTSLAC